MAEDTTVGELQKTDTTKIIVKINEFQGEKGIDIREYVTTKKYTGPTKKGTRIPVSKWKDFIELLNKVDV